MEALPLQAGDIVVFDVTLSDISALAHAVLLVDLTKAGERPHNYEEKFFDCLQNNEETVGAVVMNCNPFILGYYYLIEQAAKRFAHLVVFVVEEDRSEFPFWERFRLVQEGTIGLKHVSVLPSGRFIISSLTFSEYFNKSKLQERAVDPSLGIAMFASQIAPCLHITKRFVGKEPYDQVTRYNKEMKLNFPKYGIELIEIPRLEIAGVGAVGASNVRNCLKKLDFQKVELMVPPVTLQYLKEHLEL